MSKAIPIEWINKHLEWLDNCDNEFAQLAAVSIKSMVKIWQSEQKMNDIPLCDTTRMKGADNE